MPKNDNNACWRMGGITVGAVEDYLYSMLPARDEVLTEIETEAAQAEHSHRRTSCRPNPVSIGADDQCQEVFELGSAIGYSTIWWARAVGEGGRVIYTDGDRKKADQARGYFSEPASPTGSPSRPATRWSCCPKRKNTSTSFSAMSTKKTIPGS